VKFIISL